MDKQTSFDEVCRACYTTNATLYINVDALMPNVAYNISYRECFYECTLIDEHPQLPPTMCYKCALALQAAFIFIKKCRETAVALRIKQEDLQKSSSEFEWIAVEKQETEPQQGSEQAMNFLHNERLPETDNEVDHKRDVSLPLRVKQEELQESNIQAVCIDTSMVQKKHQRAPCRIRNFVLTDQLTKPKDEMVNCSFCHKSYHNRLLAIHILGVHSDQRLFCDACPRSFDNATTLERHRKTHDPSRLLHFSCEFCERKFSSEIPLRAHMESHDKKRTPNFACDRCDTAFFGKGALTSHMKTHMETHPKAYLQCKECHKTFVQAAALQSHMHTHARDMPYQCDRCEKSYTVRWRLRRHQRTHEECVL